MDAQPLRNNRRRRRKNNNSSKKEATAPVLIAARRPGSPRIEKPTRRMKAASARPRTAEALGSVRPAATPSPANSEADELPKKRDVRIVQRKLDEVDDAEKARRKLLAQFLASEGRAAITRAADAYLTAGFALPREQDAQLKLLEHFDETRAREALNVLRDLLAEEAPRQLPVFRQRLRRLEDYADDAVLRAEAAELRKTLPG